MKTLFAFILIGITVTTLTAQTIRRVNNNPGVTGVNVYTTAQAAHDAAVANDILMIEPSVTSYGNLILAKPLKIYGNGYYLGTNAELKADQRYSFLANVEFDTGSGGSEMSGISYDYVGGSGIHIYGVSNVRLNQNNLTFVNIYNYNKANTTNSNVSNITISKNVLLGWYFTGPVNANPTASYTISNVLVTNNILTYPGSGSSLDAIGAGSTTGIQNWVVRNNTITKGLKVSLVNSIFENNLFTSVGGVVSFFNVTSSYNVSASPTFSGGVGNQNNYDVSTFLIGSGVSISDDEQYQIKTGSPLKTAGSGGTEVGAYGGTTPYVVSGIPAIPSIINMLNTATGSNSTPLSVTISVKANN